MQLFQTIWNILTTENPLVLSIIGIPMVIVETTLIMLLFTQLLNLSSTITQKMIFISLTSIIGIISPLIIPSPYYSFINLLSIPILVLIIFKTTILKAILSEIFPYAISLIIIASLIEIYTFLFNISSDIVVCIPIHKLFYSLISYLLIFLIYLLFKKFNITIELLDKMKKRNTIILLINFIIGSISILIQIYIINSYIDCIPSVVVLSIIFTSIIYFLISMLSLFRTNKLEITAKQLEEEQLYNKTLTILSDNIRGFRHDFNNIVQAIGGYIKANDMTGLKEYYSQLLGDCQEVNHLLVFSPDVINNPAVYSLLTSKYHKAKDLGIKVSIETFLDFNTINMKIYELTRVLGILLDNAIEASSKCEEKHINIIIRKDSKAKRQLFQIENTYTNKAVNTDQIFEKGFTSKSDTDNKSHGLGLWEVRQILKKNNNLNLFTSKDDMFFKQQLEIYY